MASFRVGNQSAYSAEPLAAPFDFALANGFAAFEWFPDKRPDGPGWVAADLDSATRQSLRSRARDAGVCLSVHAPLGACPLVPRSHRELDESIRLALDLGAGLLNVHLEGPGSVDEFAAAVLPFVRRCAVSGVKLAIENTPAGSPEDFNRLFAVLPRQDGQVVVGMCLDIGHANLHHTTHNDYVGYLDRLSAEVPILHVHAHENWGDRDSHLPLFTGPAGRDPSGIAALLRRLARRGFDGCVILEQWPTPRELLVQARDRLEALIPREGE